MHKSLRAGWHTGAVLSIALMVSGSLSTAVGQTATLFVPNNAANTLGRLTIDNSTGALTALTPINTSNFPYVATTTPDNRFMFVADLGGTIDAYVVASDGTITPVGPPFVNAGSVTGIGIAPNGKFLYASNGTGNQLFTFSIDQTSGRLTQVGSPMPLGAATLPRGMAVDAAGHLYLALAGAGSIAQYTINGTNGALSGGATIASGVGTQQLAINPAGTQLFAGNLNGGTVTAFTIGSGTGLLTPVGSVTLAAGSPQGLVVNASGTALFVVDFDNSQVVAYSIGGSGVLTFSNVYPVGALPVGIAIDPAGKFLYISNSGSASVTKYSIADVALSARADFSSNGSTPLFLIARAFPSPTPPFNVVPTLSTWALILLGVLLAASSTLLSKRAYR
jgi:6-phosphogluconolactonase (cycloisomerase 2 family)